MSQIDTVTHDQTEGELNQDNKKESSIAFRKSEDERKVFIKGGEASRIYYNPSQAPKGEADLDDHDALFLSPANAARIPAKRSFWFRVVQTFGVLGSIGWISLCVFYFVLEGGIVTQTPYEMGIFVAGMVAPIAFFWMLLSYMQRNTDVRYYAESMRNELHSLFFPSESDSVRVNKDIEHMSLQAAELAASSKAALKAIHRARQGLRHEIKEFMALARKAEHHIIGLSDTMTERTTGLNDLTNAIEKRIEVIENKSEKSISAWDQASVRMVERASDIETTMDKGANRILSMADVAEEKSKAVSEMFDGTITSLGLTVDAVIDRLGGINDEFSTHTRTLERSGEELSKEASRLGAMFDDQIDQINDATARSVETLTQSMISVGNQKDILEESAVSISRKADRIAEVIGQSVSQLSEAADCISEKAETVEGRITEKATMIAQSLDGLDDQIDRIDSVSELASHRLSEGIETAINGSTQISEAIRRGVETLTRVSEDATSKAKAQIEATISHVQQLKEVGEGNVGSVESMVSLLERSREQIEKASKEAQHHVENLNRAVDGQGDKLEASALSLADHVKSVTRALEEPLRLVGIAIADADGRHEQIEETLSKRVRDLREASEKATESVETIRDTLRTQTNDIASLSGKVTAQAKTLNEELLDNRTLLNDTVQNTLADMNKLINKVSETRDFVEFSSQNIVANMKDVSTEADINLSRLNDGAVFAGQALKQAGSAFYDETQGLEEAVEKASTQVRSVTEAMTYASDKIVPLCERVETRSGKAQDALENFRDQYVETSIELIEKMDQAGVSFDDRLLKLQTGVETARDTLKSTGSMLTSTIDDINAAGQTANETMRSLANSMEGQSSDIHILTDQAVLKVETIQKAINNQFLEITEAVGHAVSRIEDASVDFTKNTDKMTASAEDVLDRFVAVGEEAEIKAYKLKEASYVVANTAQQVVSDITKEISLLDTNSENALSNLRKTSDSLSIKSREIDTMMKSVLEQAKAYGMDMRNQVQAIAVQSDESANSISQSISSLLSRMDDVNGRTKSVIGMIHDTNQSLYDQSGRFVTAVAKSAQAAEQATDMFTRQSAQLLKAADAAVEKAKQIEKSELRTNRDNFLSSARFVLESLHSLSIDFVRMIDGDIAEKDWKSYQKGDVAVFTGHLAKRLDDMPADKIRDKYAEDVEFRSYVQKFMRQFEDILDQTDTIDRGAVLGTTFAASDVGKIYRFLVNVTGRETKRQAA